MSRWKYPTKTVTVDGNSVMVRCLTAKERSFVMENKTKREAGAEGALNTSELGVQIVMMGSVEKLSKEDVESMPSELLDQCAADIMELTNGKKAETAETSSSANIS